MRMTYEKALDAVALVEVGWSGPRVGMKPAGRDPGFEHAESF